jgi:hypothetical protein
MDVGPADHCEEVASEGGVHDQGRDPVDGCSFSFPGTDEWAGAWLQWMSRHDVGQAAEHRLWTKGTRGWWLKKTIHTKVDTPTKALE